MPSKNKDIIKKHRDNWYYKNKTKQIARQLERRKELLEWLDRYRSSLQCSDCGMVFLGKPECCDFHHLDPSTKEGNVYKMIVSSKAALEREIEKCIPLCANCHRTRHKSR